MATTFKLSNGTVVAVEPDFEMKRTRLTLQHGDIGHIQTLPGLHLSTDYLAGFIYETIRLNGWADDGCGGK